MEQRERLAIANKAVDGLIQSRRQLRPDPDNKIRILKRARLRRAQGVVVRGLVRRQQLLWFANTLHNLGDQRLYW